nr:hypothetical protein BaRGS_022211 [Batillaria attramentaria]
MSKDDLVAENERLVKETERLKSGLEEVQQMFNNLEWAYTDSKGTFSLSRYGHLKDMIKKVTSDEVMKMVQSLSDSSSRLQPPEEKRGMAGLLQKAREFGSGEEGADGAQKQASSGGDKGGGKVSGFFKKLKDMTGFSDGPPDIRCLDKEDIRKDNERKHREVNRLNMRGQRAFARLEQLQSQYQASKAHAPPTRYQELKDMIKTAIADKQI